MIYTSESKFPIKSGKKPSKFPFCIPREISKTSKKFVSLEATCVISLQPLNPERNPRENPKFQDVEVAKGAEKVGPTFCNHLGVSKNRETPQNGWFIMENSIKMDDLGVPVFSETPISQKVGLILGDGCRSSSLLMFFFAIFWFRKNVTMAP